MRKVLLLFSICALISNNALALETDDYFTISTAELTPNGDYVMLTVGLQGSRLYTAYNLDITLPPGVDVYYFNGNPVVLMDKDTGIYPFDVDFLNNKTYTHTLSYSYGVQGERVLRLSCFSATNQSFTATSGNLFQMALVASAFAKPGTNTIRISGGNLTAIEDNVNNKYVPADKDYEVLTIGSGSSLDININAGNKFSTCILPFDCTPSGFSAYSANSVDGDYIVLDEVQKMSAYTPYIIYNATGFTGKVSGTVDGSKYVATATSGLLTGAIEPQKITDGYVMQNKGEGSMFYKVDGQAFTIPAGKCWYSQTSGAKDALGFEFDNTPSGISKLADSIEKSSAVYDLNGHLIANPQIGQIYIINNKKVLKVK